MTGVEGPSFEERLREGLVGQTITRTEVGYFGLHLTLANGQGLYLDCAPQGSDFDAHICIALLVEALPPGSPFLGQEALGMGERRPGDCDLRAKLRDGAEAIAYESGYSSGTPAPTSHEQPQWNHLGADVVQRRAGFAELDGATIEAVVVEPGGVALSCSGGLDLVSWTSESPGYMHSCTLFRESEPIAQD